MLSGVVVIFGKDPIQHQGVSLTAEGTVNLQLSAKSVGVFEAFYNSVKVRGLGRTSSVHYANVCGGFPRLSGLVIACCYFARCNHSPVFHIY